MPFVQQGDVILEIVKDIPKGAEPLPKPILLHSDRTNHTHQVVGKGAKVFKDNNTCYVQVPSSALVKHEEHKDIKLAKGFYRMRIVQEYSHFDEEARNAID